MTTIQGTGGTLWVGAPRPASNADKERADEAAKAGGCRGDVYQFKTWTLTIDAPDPGTPCPFEAPPSKPYRPRNLLADAVRRRVYKPRAKG